MNAVLVVGVGATLAAVVIAIALACREANRTIDAVLNGPATLDQRDVDLRFRQLIDREGLT